MENRKIELLALVLPIFLLFFVQGVFSLQEVAGPLVIQTPIGGSNSAQWGLLNDGNQTITVDLSASGNAAPYLSFPTSVILQPGIIDYVTITAILPNTYSGGNMAGTLYALQEGNSGQVQVNVQLTKNVTIVTNGQPATTTTTSFGSSGGTFVNTGGNIFSNVSSTTTSTTQTTTSAAPSPTTSTTSSAPTTTTSPSIFTGFAALLISQPQYLLIILFFLVMFLILAIYRMRNKRKEPETNANETETNPSATENI